MKKIMKSFLFFLLGSSILPMVLLAEVQPESPKLIIFHSLSCHRCEVVKTKIMPLIEKEFASQVEFDYRELGNVENYKLLLGLMQQYRSQVEFKIPIFYFQGKFINGEGKIYTKLENLIKQGLKKPGAGLSLVPADLIAYFKNFVPLSVVAAGLEDGINPCAFTVIVFFISFLALQGYRKRELIVIGLSFIFAVFLTYLAVGLGIFNFLYRFRGLWGVTHFLNLTFGAASIVFGILAFYDFIKFKRSGSTEGLALQLPKTIKMRIHKVVGFFYRKDRNEKGGAKSHGLTKLILSALVTGFLVSLLEAVCTGQMYLPTIAFVLKASEFKIQALGYLLLYNVMFIIPLLVIFVFALMGTTSSQFTEFLKRHLGFIKIAMAILFFSLGVFLIWRG